MAQSKKAPDNNFDFYADVIRKLTVDEALYYF